MRTLTALAAAVWFALLSGVLLLVFWVDHWLAKDREGAE